MRDQIIRTFGLARLGGHGGGASTPDPLAPFALDAGAITATNLTDGGTAAFTVEQAGEGVTLRNTEHNDILAFATGLTVSGDMHVRHTIDQTPKSGKTTGIAVRSGTGRRRFWAFPANGWFHEDDTRITSKLDKQPGTPMRIVFDYFFRAADQSLTIHYAMNGGAPYVFSFGNVPPGEIELLGAYGHDQTHRLERRSLSLSAPSVAPADMHRPLGHTPRAVPAGFSRAVPGGFEVCEDGGSYHSSVALTPPLSEANPEVLALHVDGATGDDANPGTADAPLKSLHVAVARGQQGGAVMIRAKGGLYPYATCLRNYPQARLLQITSWDGAPVISSMHDDSLAWAADDGAYTATLPAGSVSNVFDAAHLTAGGDYSALDAASGVAACQATAGTWFQDGTSVWVHTSDGRAPDGDLRVYTRRVANNSDQYGLCLREPGTALYMEKVHLEGGWYPFYAGAAVADGDMQIYARDCAVKYAAANTGWKIVTSGVAVLQDCVGAANRFDGFNYQPASAGGAAPFVLEIGCTGRGNGFVTDNICNGSSSHGAAIIRVNGSYTGNKNRNVHDIDQDGQIGETWNLGCTARDPVMDYANWAAGHTTGGVTKMWLDGCTSSGGRYDIEANGSASVFLSGFTGAGTNDVNGSGSIEAYVP
ncbi:MAG: hypothetical protein CSA74_11635 [Rhodobacterales bacterium]|nr:MAG: hypothetical protein CSA74_11635 [Rhodobacterales bacterium]